MAAPDFQTLMRPVLGEYADGQERPISVVRERVAHNLGLTPADLEERLPSGAARTYANRIGWATTYLYRVGLLERPRRSIYRITQRGREVLESHPDRIDLAVLRQFPELQEFRSGQHQEEVHEATPPATETQTPEERIEAAYAEHRLALARDLLDRVGQESPEFFEQLVLDVLIGMGYGGSRKEAAERLGRTGDGGIDGVIQEDRLGLDLIYVQAKRWKEGRTVGRPDIQAFVGALHGAGAPKGVFITTSGFSPDGRTYAGSITTPRVILIDGARLAELMVDYDVGVTTTARYALKKLDADYFTLDDEASG